MCVSVKAPIYLALEIGGTKLQLAVFDAQLLLSSIDFDSKWIVNRVRQASATNTRNLGAAASADPPGACAVGFGGPLDYENEESPVPTR